MAQREAQALATTDGSEHQWAGRAEGDDGDHRVLGAAAPDPVAVPGDTVPPVAVEAHACGDEGLAQLGSVVAVEVVAGVGERGVRKALVPAVPTQQPWDG